MDLVTWDERLSVGSPVVDGQHRRLLSVRNALYAAMVDGHGEGAAGAALSDLERYATVHLAYEESLLQKARYPEYERHRTMHDAMRRTIRRIAARHAVEDLRASDLLKLLAGWFRGHIADADRRYADFLRERRDEGR